MAHITAAIGIGWVVSPVISLAINKIETYIEKNYFKKSETEKNLKEMKISLLEIQTIMTTVEKERIEEEAQLVLVREIKSAVCDAEDVLDEFEYILAEEESMNQQKEDNCEHSSSNLQNQQKEVSCTADSVSSFIEVAKFGYEKIKEKGKEISDNLDWPILGDGELKEKVKKVSENLVRLKDSAEILFKVTDLNNRGNIKSSQQQHRYESSSLEVGKYFGREEECEKLKGYLFEEQEGPPAIIQIVGQGGIGKTTLAQMAFNDPEVTKHFDQTVWLYVSENFDKLKLTKEMLKCVSPSFPTTDVTNLHSLQTELVEQLKSRKILLVLDDVWFVKDRNQKSSYEEDWLQFLAPLRKANTGSKIIVTTREGVVEDIFESFSSLELMELSGLMVDAGWSLLQFKAFGSRKVDNLQELEPIGKEIVKKLEGSALAIRVVGAELKRAFNVEKWKRVLNEINSLEKSDDIMQILLRSYEHLTENLQHCFAYCSLFPKGYSLKPNRLVQMWMAHGFVPCQKGNILDRETIGLSYFNELKDRSFIQVVNRDEKEYYVMHDLMNDLACCVSEG